MTLIALVIGLILIAAAVRNTQTELFQSLAADLPPFAIWGAALVAVGALGFIPAVKTPSRYLLALVILVIILANYQAILSGFAAVSQPGKATSAGPASAQATATPPAAGGAGAGTPKLGQAPSPASYGLPTTWSQGIASGAAALQAITSGQMLQDITNTFGSGAGG